MDKVLQFATKAVVIKDRKILSLYIEKNGQKKWDLPGGRIEFGESPEEGLVREVMEETNCRVKSMKLIDTWHRVLESWQIIGVFYICELEGEIILSSEHNGYEWINIDEFFNVFTATTFTERMLNWDWKSLVDDINLIGV